MQHLWCLMSWQLQLSVQPLSHRLEAEPLCGSELVGGCSLLPPSSSHQPEKFVPPGLSSVSNFLLPEGAAIPGVPVPSEKEGGQSPLGMDVPSAGTLQRGC